MDRNTALGELEWQLLKGTLSWYIGYTVSPLDTKAIRDLELIGVVVYVPRMKVDRVMRGKLGTHEQALYPHYVFLGVDGALQFSKIKDGGRVLDILHMDGEPYVVDSVLVHKTFIEELEMIHDETVEADKKHKRNGVGIDIGSDVRITEGPMEGRVGKVVTRVGTRVILELSQFERRVKIKFKSVEMVQ